MHLREGEYDKAHTDFFEAFKVSTLKMGFEHYLRVVIVLRLYHWV